MMKGTTKQPLSGISYAGKVVLVTGAASGIGRAMALAFGRAGACVVIADTAVDGGHMTAALIVEAGGKALYVKTNVTSGADVTALIDKIVAHYGRIDVAVNSAGVEEESLPMGEGEDEQFDRIMNVNVKGVWLCMKSQLRQMLKQEGGGAILNVADAGGLVAVPNHAVYSASKHAVIGLTKTSTRSPACGSTACARVRSRPRCLRACSSASRAAIKS
jgi:NAD(P)-dependent dehydrogenase (short-subunit alcohol dehydrogenase family)